MRNATKILLSVTVLVAAQLAFAQATPAPTQSWPVEGNFSLLQGSIAPLTIKLKELDSNWRVFTASSSSYESLISSAMGGGVSRIYTKGQTVMYGTDTFLIAYKADVPNMTMLMRGGSGMPKPTPLTENTVLKLSLINLHSFSSMDSIQVFDLKEQLASARADKSLLDITTPTETIESGTTEIPKEAGEPPLLGVGSRAPDFTVRDVKGKAVRLSDYRGKVVVIDFWSTWCGPCQQSLPGTSKVAAEYASKGVVVLGVNVWDKKSAFDEWIPKHKNWSSIKFVIDTAQQPKDVAQRLYKVSGIPTQYVIDRKGRVVKSLVGYSGDESQLVKAIKTALARG